MQQPKRGLRYLTAQSFYIKQTRNNKLPLFAQIQFLVTHETPLEASYTFYSSYVRQIMFNQLFLIFTFLL